MTAASGGPARPHGRQSEPGSRSSSAHPPRIALIGFMGSGKSTVGRLLARRLGYRFVDVDELIESRAGTTIREIFAAQGEEAFRRLESETLEGLAGEERIVAAAGGGAPVPVRNREFFAVAALSFYLEVSFEESLRRTGSDPGRPLLQRGTGELRSLYEQRRPVYESLGRRVPTEARSPEEIVEEILRVLRRGR